MASPPTIATHVLGHLPTADPSLKTCVYLRKLGNKSQWLADASAGERLAPHPAAVLAENVFFTDTPPYSIFRVSTDDDLQRVIMGMKSGVISLTSRSCFVAILPEEIESANVSLNKTPGDTFCDHANQRHYEVSADQDTLIQLCELMRSREGVIEVRKPEAKQLKALMQELRCKVVQQANGSSTEPGTDPCQAPACPPE